MEDWAEIRRLHRSEGLPIKEIARRMGIARNTVRAALRADGPPKRERKPRGSLADAVEPQVRQLLTEFPRMPATVIAERIGWEYSMTTLKDRIRTIRPEYAGVDPVDRVSYEPGRITQCDLGAPPCTPCLGRVSGDDDSGRSRAGTSASGAGDDAGVFEVHHRHDDPVAAGR